MATKLGQSVVYTDSDGKEHPAIVVGMSGESADLIVDPGTDKASTVGSVPNKEKLPAQVHWTAPAEEKPTPKGTVEG